tara:strand:+ start:52 stop:1491 length:1440 start_codon:yes stop_codon:yes gene_type:complete
MANDNPRLEATSKPSQVRLNIDPENPEAGGQFLPTIFMATKVTRTGRKNSDGTPIFTTEVIRYDNAKKDNPVVIATSSSEKGFRDNNGNENYDNRLKPTANATAAEKASMELAIRNAQLDQVRSVEDQVTTSPADSRELFKVGGDGSESENPDDGIDINEEQASKPLPNNVPNPFKGFAQPAGGWRYPLDLDSSKQDTLKIVAYERQPRRFSGGAQTAASGFLARRDTSNLGSPKGTIILPINGQIVDNSSVDYGDNTLNALEAFVASTAFTAVAGEVSEGSVGSQLKAAFKNLNVNEAALKEIIGSAAAAKGLNAISGTNQTANSIASRLSGTILNPNLELLFKGPQLRNFPFTYLFLPREKGEADQVIGIIRTLKENMTPRIQSNFFLKSPNIFSVEYLKGGTPHPYLNRIKLCALRSCNVEYAPLGTYATFPDGMPHAVRMTLQFTELDPVYSEDYGEAAGTGSSFDSSNASLIGY